MNGRQLKQRVIEEYTTSCVSDSDGLSLYELKAAPVHKDEATNIQVLAVGPATDKETIAVLLLGETGAGKTRLTNTLINIVFGVQLADDFRFAVKDQVDVPSRSQIHSQTDYITAYLINHMDGMMIDCSIMIIDTPGFYDTRGVECENRASELLSSFLLNDFGIDYLHCVGLVAKANQNRISKYQVDVLNEFSSVLSYDATPVTKLLATFASDDNHVHEVVRAAGISFSSVYEFDNWPLYKRNPNDSCRTSAILEFRWENMEKECVRFLKELSVVPPMNLKNTRDLHEEKKLLSEAKDQLMTETRLTGEIVRTLPKLKLELKNYTEKAKHTNWKCSEKTVTVERYDVAEGYHAHNCKVCKKTCVASCQDPSNVVAGVVGTTSGVGTAFATGLGSAMCAGGVIGSEVGLLGGPIGVGVGSCIGLASGLAVGISAGIKSRKTKAECPLVRCDSVCEEDGCPHKLSDHQVEHFAIAESEDLIEKVNAPLKLKYGSLMDMIKKTQGVIKEREETMQVYKESLTMLAVRIVKHTRRISELSMNSEYVTPEKIIDEMIKDVEDEEQIKVLRMCLSAMKLLENPSADSAMSQEADKRTLYS